MEKVTIKITAEAKVRLSKVVEMQVEDWQKYQDIVSSNGSWKEVDTAIAKIADKYGFGYGEDIIDMDDPEEVTFDTITISR